MITIRKCELGDQKAVKKLIVKIMNEEFPKEASSFPLEDLENISGSYGKLGEAFFVAVSNGSIIGTVGIKREDDRTAMLRRLFVDSNHRRKRIGTRLVEKAVEFCRDVGYDEIIFKTNSAMNNAIKLCEKKKFVPRAKLDLGAMQLVKFGLFLKGEALLPRK
jgi:GNAT superfamily N-acetyltransferase